MGQYETAINRVLLAFRGCGTRLSARYWLDLHRWSMWDGKCFTLDQNFLRVLLNDQDRGYSVLPLTVQWCEGCALSEGQDGHLDKSVPRLCTKRPVAHAMLLVLCHRASERWYTVYDPSQHDNLPNSHPGNTWVLASVIHQPLFRMVQGSVPPGTVPSFRELRGDFGSILAAMEDKCTLGKRLGYRYRARRQRLTHSLQERLEPSCPTSDHGLCVPINALVLSCALRLGTYDLHHVSDRLAAVLRPHSGPSLAGRLTKWYEALYRGEERLGLSSWP